MDVHRCRFVEYPPSPINAVAVSHPPGKQEKPSQVRLAVGRGNGNIEIWNPLNGLWIHESTLYGGRDRSIEGLAWIQDPDDTNGDGLTTAGRLRLFSIGNSSVVTEWDLQTGQPLRQSSGTNSEIWCIAAQPLPRRDPSKKQRHSSEEDGRRNQRLAIGCADGSIISLSTANDDVTFEKYIARASERKTRALCITWKSPTIVAAGFADSSIRIFKIERTRKDPLIRTISLGRGPKGGRKEKLVWTLDCLPDGTLVSGDSTGEICWWDRSNYGQQQKIKAHDADVLCLATSSDGKNVYSGGIDRRTVSFRLDTRSSTGPGRWAKITHRRIHTHDVKSMASVETHKLSVIVSGGPDARLTLMPMQAERNENHRRLPFVSQRPPLASAGRLIVSWWNRQATVWRIRPRQSNRSHGNDWPWSKAYDTVARIALKGEENITSASLSRNGDLLAISTVAETKLFRMWRKDDDSGKLKVSKVSIPASLARKGARLVQFSPDVSWLLLIPASNEPTIYHVRAPGTEDQHFEVLDAGSTLKRSGHRESTQDSSGQLWDLYNRRISQAAFSADSRILALSDLSGYVATWTLARAETITNGQKMSSLKASSTLSTSPSDSESSSESEPNGDQSLHEPGQKWRLNPYPLALPHLQSAPMVLSFCSTETRGVGQEFSFPDGDFTRPKHRHGQHNNDNLLIITSTHEIVEFSVTSGKLTSWSRRNPSAALPINFKAQRDRAIGCIWDCNLEEPSARKRIWIYSSSWLAMLDLNQDLPLPKDRIQSRKRKREDEIREESLSQRNTAGAGSVRRIEDGESLNTDTTILLRQDGKEQNITKRHKTDSIAVNENESEEEVENMNDDELDKASLGLLRQRRQASSEYEDSDDELNSNDETVNKATHGDGRNGPSLNGYDSNEGAMTSSVQKAKGVPSFFITFKFRPILGIVPLSEEDEGEDVGAKSLVRGAQDAGRDRRFLEVAIVERLETDLELPARFQDGHKWEK